MMQPLHTSQQSIEQMRQMIMRDAKIAHDLLHQAQVLEAIQLYHKILKRNFASLFDLAPTVHQTGQSSSFVEVIYDISSYYFHARDWRGFSRLYTIYSNHTGDLSPDNDMIVWVETVNLYNRIFHNGNLEEITKQVENYLTLPFLTEISRALLHYVLTMTYRLLRDEKKALFHITQSLNIISLEEEPYFYVFFLEGQAAIYYFLNQGREHYFHKAIDLFNESEQLAREVAKGYDFTHNAYNLGWCEAELGNYKVAGQYFEQGLAVAISSQEIYIQAQSHYGLGYINLEEKKYDTALKHLYKALAYFVSTSYLMTGVSLYIMSMCYTGKGDYTSALDRLDNALDNLNKVQNPVQRRHVCRQFSIVYYKDGQYLNALAYFLKTYYLRIRYKMPLFPY